MLGTEPLSKHVTILGASLVSRRLSIVHHVFSIQHFQIKIRSFLHYLFSNFEYYMGNCVHCFMVCSQIRHVSILDASPGSRSCRFVITFVALTQNMETLATQFRFHIGCSPAYSPSNSLSDSISNITNSLITNSLITTSHIFKQSFKSSECRTSKTCRS